MICATRSSLCAALCAAFGAIILAPFSSQAALVAHWPMDEGTGIFLQDVAGGHNAELQNPEFDEWIITGLAPVPSGTTAALDLGGGGDHAVVTDGYKGVLGTQARTIAAWIRTTDQNAPIVAWGPNTTGNKWIFRVQDSNGVDGAIRVEVNGGYIVGNTFVADDRWHHVAAVLPNGVTDVQDMLLYVDGVYDGFSARQSQSIDTTAGPDLMIGLDQQDRYFGGNVDDLRIYDHDLLPSEIVPLFTASAFAEDNLRGAVLNDNPVGYWRLSDSSGPATNIGTAGAGHPDTLNGSYANDATRNARGLLTSENNGAVLLDTVNAQVNIPDDPGINTGGPYQQKTFELWFKADNVQDRQVLFEQGGGTHGMNLYVENGDVHLGAWRAGGNDMAAFLDWPIEVGKTYHVAMVFDQPGDTMTGYINGMPFGTLSGLMEVPSHSGDVAIGRMRNDSRFDDGSANGQGQSGAGFGFQGRIDEVSTYNAALAPDRIATHFALGEGYSRDVLLDDPIAYWRLGEVTGTTAANVATGGSGLGSAVDGTYAGGFLLGRSAVVSNSADSAAGFDGSNGRVDIPDNSQINTGSFPEKTIEVWFQADDPSARQVVYEQGGGGNGLNVYVENGSLHVGAWKNNGNDYVAFLDTPIRGGVPYHAALVFDRPNDAVTGYLNGTAFDEATGLGLIDMPSHSGNIAIAGRRDASRFDDGSATGTGSGGNGNYFAGTVDDVSLYNTALSPGRLGHHFAMSQDYARSILLDDPIVYWRLGDRIGGQAVNIATTGSGTGDVLDANYGGNTTQNVPGLVYGDPNGAALFDGSNGSIMTVPNPDPNPINQSAGDPGVTEKTIELWFNAYTTDGRQVLYEQGGHTRGLNVYIDDGELYVQGWNVSNDGAGSPWGGNGSYVSTPVVEGETHHVALVLDQPGGNLFGYLDGSKFGKFTNAGRLYNHGNEVGIGGMIENAKFFDGNANDDGLAFRGTLDDVALFKSVIDPWELGYQQAQGELYGRSVLADDPVTYLRLGESGNITQAMTIGLLAPNARGDWQGTDPNPAPSLVAATNNRANRFDGATNYVQLLDADGFNQGEPWEKKTVELWFSAEDVGTDKQVLYEQGGLTRGMSIYAVEEGGADMLYVGAWSRGSGEDNVWEQFLGTPIAEDETHHVALVLDSNSDNNESGTLRGYLDGIEFASTTGANRLFAHGDDGAIGAQTVNTVFHDGDSPGEGSFFQGTIDEVATYNKALGPASLGNHAALGRPAGAAILGDDPIAYWRLGEAAGTTATNVALHGSGLGAAVDGTYTGGVTLGQPGLIVGDPNAAAGFDGAGSFVAIPLNDAIGGVNSSSSVAYTQKSIELWFQADDTSARQVLFEQGGATNGLNVYLEDGSVHLGAWRGGGGDYAVFLDKSVAPGSLNQVALVFDQENDVVTGYLNGTAFGSVQGTGLTAMPRHTGRAAIGAMDNDSRFDDGTATGEGVAGQGFPFAGTVDDVALFNSALSPKRVGIHQARSESYGQMVLADRPVAYWRLGESGVTTAPNLGLLDNHGSYQGTGPVTAPSIIPATGNPAGSFDGTINGTVLLPDAAGFNQGGPYENRTIELWFNAGQITDTKQVIFEEGGQSRGLNLYTVEENGQDLLYFGGWNRPSGDADDPWEIFLSQPIQEGRTYYAALVLDSNGDDAESGMLLGYLNGLEVDSATGANRLFNHGDDGAIGGMLANSWFHDGAGSGDGLFFQGMIDDVAIYNYALSGDDILGRFTQAAVPEPATLALMGLGLAIFGGYALRRRRGA